MTPEWVNGRDSLHREIAKLRETVETQATHIERLNEIINDNQASFHMRWKMTGTEARILQFLMCGRLISRDQMMFLLYPNDADMPDDKLLDVCLHKIRAKLRKDGLGVEIIWGRGWYLKPYTIKRIRELCAEAIQVAA